MQSRSVIRAHGVRQTRYAVGVGEVARVRANRVSPLTEYGGSSLDFRRGSIDEHERRAEVSEGGGDGFSDLALAADTG
jgi:hypothetical protein